MAWVSKVSNQPGSLTETEITNNAAEVYNFFSARGWTLNAISGLLGNMQKESYINPGQWQIGFKIGSASAGFGLVQWTPSTKYTNWCSQRGRDIYSGFWQCYTIDTQDYGTEWIKTAAYPLSYADFKKSTKTPEYLAAAFLKNYERAGVEDLETRQAYARKWFDYFGGATPIPPTPPAPPTPHATAGKLIFYCLRRF